MIKKVIAYLLISSISISFIACQNKQKVPEETKAPDNTPATQEPAIPTGLSGNINFWVMPNSALADKDLLTVCKPFLDANPEVKITPTVVDWGTAWVKITAAATTGEAPDITQLGTTWVGAISYMEALEDLTDKIDWAKFQDSVLDTAGLLGSDRKTAVPWFAETRALFYRKDACEKAGVNPETDFATWENFKEALQKLNNVEIDGVKLPALGMPGKNDTNVIHNFMPWIYGAGGEFVSADGTEVKFNSPEALEGIKFYSELALEGLMDKLSLEKSTNEVEEAFCNGAYCVSILGPWNIANLEKNKADGTSNIVDKIGVAMIPEGPKGRKAFLGGSTLAVFKSSKNKEAAIALCDYLSNKTAQVAYSNITGFLPTNKEAYEDPTISKHELRKVFKDQMKYAQAYPSIASWGPAENCFREGLSKIWDNVMGINGAYDYEITKRVVDEVVDQVNEVIEQTR
jgi:multiple sugar transport system substrate-binding protein